ncbi:MAG: FkbM family methyltransferase [Candidatus Electrothrix sp. AR4]|nr:FkbM family methyltransferase [Candidatus Electrothrix sp. AR4]
MSCRCSKPEREIIEQERGGQRKTALDIGANIGNHTVYLSEFFDKIIAFEPNPTTYSVLKINTNHLSNVVCLDTGVSSKKGSIRFQVNELNMGGSRIVSGNHADEDHLSQININVLPIDDINELKSETIEFIKIDVEGHEIEVIRGMTDTLCRNKPIIAFEQEAAEIIDGSSMSINELKNIGYNYFYSIDSRRSKVNHNIHRLLRVPLQLIEIIFFGDGKDIAEFNQVSSFERKQYNMIIASMEAIPVN